MGLDLGLAAVALECPSLWDEHMLLQTDGSLALEGEQTRRASAVVALRIGRLLLDGHKDRAAKLGISNPSNILSQWGILPGLE